MSSPAELALGHRLSAREAGLWVVAGVAVVLAHVAASFAFASMAEPPPAADATEAMVVELAPLPFASSEAVIAETVSEDEPTEQLAPEETEAEPVEEETVAEATAEATPEPVPPDEMPVVDETQPETVEQEVPEPVEDEVVGQEVAEAVEPEVVLPMPRPDRVVEEPRPAPPKKRVERKRAETPKPAKKAETRRDARTKPEASVSSSAAKAPTVNPARWNSAVRAAIARRAGRARGMKGTVQVQFVVNRSGSIVSARVAGSSGDGRLDSAALGMVRSARVPAPPPGLPGSSHSFMIPLSFR